MSITNKSKKSYFPVDWKIKKLKEITTICDSGNWGENPNNKDKTYPILRSNNISLDGNLILNDIAKRKLNENEFLKCKLREQDIVIVKSSGSTKHIAKKIFISKEISEKKFGFTNFLLRISLDEKKVNPKFVYFYLTSNFEAEFVKAITPTTTGLMNLNIIDYLNQIIPIPPLKEQTIITEILNHVNDNIESIKNTINNVRLIKQGLLQQLLTKGIGHTEFKETPLGRIPKEWEIREIGDLIETKYGTSMSLNENNQGFPAIKMGNITYDGKLFLNKISFVNITRKEFQEHKLKKGDLLFNRTNSLKLVGKVALFDKDDDYVPVSYIIRIRIKSKELDPLYLNYYFNNPKMKKYMKRLAKPGVSQANINAVQLKSIKIPLPPLSEQRRINGIISGIDSNLDINDTLVMNLLRLKKGLMQQLLTGKIRVKVDGS